MSEVATAPAILLIGCDPTEQHPLLAWQIRSAIRLRNSRLYVVNSAEIKLARKATKFAQIAAGSEADFVAYLAGNDAASATLGAL